MVLFRKKKGYRVHGWVRPGFEPVRQVGMKMTQSNMKISYFFPRQIFEDGFARGIESAAQVCVYVGEERVVDLWGVSGGY